VGLMECSVLEKHFVFHTLQKPGKTRVENATIQNNNVNTKYLLVSNKKECQV